MSRAGSSTVLALVAILALGGLALLLLAGAGGGGREVPVVVVEALPFAHRVPAEGNLRAARATPVSVPPGVPGPVKIAWLAPDGSAVRAGEAVVRFDPSDFETRLADAAADIETAELKIGKQRVESAAETEKLARDAELASTELEMSQQFQKKDELIFSRSEIIESEIDEELARERERHARAARETRRRLAATESDLLAIDHRQAALKMGQANAGLAALELKAPHDGILVFRRNRMGQPPRVGDTLWNGQPIAEIPDLGAMVAEVYVLEADAGGLAVGKPATVRLESRPDVLYRARVARVDALAKPRFRDSPVQYFGVELDLERTDPAVMKPGQRVRASLALEERASALAVPRQAVFERDGRKIVYRRAPGGGFEPVEVTLGPAAAGTVVVETGLAAGDAVALRDPTRPADTQEDPNAPAEPDGPAGAPSAVPGGLAVMR